MNKTTILAIALMSGACASTSAPDPAVYTLIEAEREFAANGSRVRVNTAFLDVLAPHAILFRPTPVDARTSLTERPMRDSLLLLWQPIYGEASYDGTLGITTGPSEYGERPSARAGTGHFLSVWRKLDGRWLLAIDAGIDAPLTTSVAGASRVLTTRAGTRSFPDDGGLAAIENSVVADYQRKFDELADEDARVFRDGTPPTSTKREAIALVQRDSAATYVPIQVIVAPSNDIGYVFGTLNPQGPNPGGYIRIYRRGARRAWRIAYDLR